MKKLLSILICISLLVSVIPMGTVFADEAELESVHTDLVALMTSLGIYRSTDDMIYRNEIINREELSSLLSIFYGITDESYLAKTDFPDVPEDWASGHILTMVDKGILTPYTDGLFRPKDNVTKAAAAKVLVTMTGYDIFAENDGGYPDGYMEQAEEIGIMDGVSSVGADSPVTRGEFTQMLYNAINVPLLTRESFGSENDFVKDENVTLLTEKLNIYYTEGLVNALPYVELGYGNGAGAGKVQVNGKVYNANIDLYDYLGTTAGIYFHKAKNDVYGEILCAVPLVYGKEVLEVSAEDISSYTKGNFSYYDGNRQKRAYVSDDVMVIFNGKRLTNFKPEHLTPSQGKVRLCDIDLDGKYDKIIVEYELNYRVSSVSLQDNCLYITDSDGKLPIKVLLDDESYSYTLTDRGLNFDPMLIEKDDIISVVADDINLSTGSVNAASRIFRMKRSDQRLVGTANAVDAEGIYIDDVLYELTDSVKINEIELGKRHTFYLNYLGKVAGFKTDVSTTQRGILVGLYEGKTGLEDEVKVRIYSQDGKFYVYDCTDNLIIDGKRKKAYESVGTALRNSAVICQSNLKVDGAPMIDFPSDVWQTIKYSVTHDGNLVSLDTLSANKLPTENDLNFVNAITGFTRVGNMIYIQPSGADYKNQQRYLLSTTCTVFALSYSPDSDGNYSIITATELDHESAPKVAVLDSDDMGVAGMALYVRTNVDAVTDVPAKETNNLLVYEGKKTMVHKDDTYDAVFGTSIVGGGRVTIPVHNISDVDKANPGDVIAYRLDSDGIATHVKLIFSLTDYNLSESSATRWYGKYNSPKRFGYGRVEKISDTHIMFRYDLDDSTVINLNDGGDSFTETLALTSSIKYFLYDSATKRVIQSSKAEIRDYARYGDDADMCLGYFRNEVINALVIVR